MFSSGNASNGKRPDAAIDFEAARREMVEHQLRRRGITDERVLQAMLTVPREEFIPESYRDLAYADAPVPIGFGQTISQPYIVALMVQSLQLEGHERVLEIGGGSGYHAAVLSLLAAEVITVEVIPELAEMARKNLERTGFHRNVLVVCGDGSKGCPEKAPYDAISVAAAAPRIPPALLEQLKPGGRMVIPIGEPDAQELRLIIKQQDGKIESRFLTYCRFVPLRLAEEPQE